jgi:hypothetical protein
MMTAMAKVAAPVQAAPVASFLPAHGGLAQEQHKFGPVKELNHQGISLSATPTLLQPKLTIGAVDDPYEREADHVAETVMRMPSPVIQRKGT